MDALAELASFPNVETPKIQRAVVFGGAGFIGSHLLRRLRDDNPDAALFCADIAEPRFRVEGVTYLRQDVREPIPANLCGEGEITIFNFAAIHTTPGHEEWEYYGANVPGATNVSRYATATGSKRIIFTSSISVYGASETPRDENSRPEPDSAYGRSKLMAENIHRLWQEEDPEKRDLTVVRPAVIYGFTENGNFTRLARLLAKSRFVYPGRKDTIKSCGYVKDLVGSMLYMAGRARGVETYNFCYPERYTSEDICAAFCEVASYPEPKRVVPIELMLLGGFGFEVLNKAGLKTTVNRARVRKLFHSTNILPARLQQVGFKYAYDLRTSLSDWRQSSPNQDFA